MAHATISGGRWIKVVVSWISWSKRRRDKRAAKKFLRRRLRSCQYIPRVIITDKLNSYGAAKRELLPGVA
jgi:transposase-like protein